MRVVTKFSVAALFASVVLAVGGVAQADDHWDHDHGWDHHRDWHAQEWREHEWREHHMPPPRYVEGRPIYVAPPIVYAPPVYQAPAPSGLNLNFNIPLQ